MKRPLWLGFTSPFLLVLAGACAAPSQSAKTSSAAEQPGFAIINASGNTVPPPAGEELICEYEETVGSHIPKRICRSKSEIQALQDETQRAFREVRPVATSNPAAASAPGH